MKFISLAGILLTIIGAVYFYLSIYSKNLPYIDFIFGVITGCGIGLIIGGIIGWFSKKRPVIVSENKQENL